MRSEPSARSIGLQPTNQRVDSCKGHIQVQPSKAMVSVTTRAAGRSRPAEASSALRRMQEPQRIEPTAGSTDRRRQRIARSGRASCVVPVVPPGGARRSSHARRRPSLRSDPLRPSLQFYPSLQSDPLRQSLQSAVAPVLPVAPVRPVAPVAPVGPSLQFYPSRQSDPLRQSLQ